jgi:invasion protein IalB
MRWLLAVAILGLFQAATATRAQEFNVWTVECEPSRPLDSNKCRIAYYAKKETGIVTAMFSYIGKDLSFLISADDIFSQAEITIDDKDVYFTQLCGEGYCLFEGSLAAQLARQFRRGRLVQFEVSAPAFGTVLIQRMDLSGFKTAFKEFEHSRRP